MHVYTIVFAAWVAGIFVSNTTGLPESCCEGEGQFSLSLGPGKYQIDYPPSLKELIVYSQVPYEIVARVRNPHVVIDYVYDNIMFYSIEDTIVQLTKLN